MIRRAAIAFLVACAVPFAVADSPDKPVDAKTRLAIEMVEIVQLDQMSKAMNAQMGAMFEEQLGELATCEAAKPIVAEFSRELSAKVLDAFNDGDMKADIAAVYAEVFSEDELKGMLDFYRSPLGKKLLDRMPELMQKSMQISQSRMKGLMPDLQKLGERYGTRIGDASKRCTADTPKPAAKKRP